MEQTCKYIWYILIGLVFFGTIVVISKNASQDSMTFFNIYLQVGTLTIFIINLLITLDNHKLQMEDRNNGQYTKCGSAAQMKINDIDKMFMTNPLLNRLYGQMYQNDKHVQKFAQIDIPETPAILKAEYHACSIIYSTMSTIFMSSIANRNSQLYSGWYFTFMKWMKSTILQSHWSSFRQEHTECFINFVDTLIASTTR